MKIHFLNVGHGDCTIIEHDSGRITMIDINNGGMVVNIFAFSQPSIAAEYDR